MIIVNKNEKTISGSVNGQPYSVSFDQEKYDKMIALRDKSQQVDTATEMLEIIAAFTPLTKESMKELVETASPYIFANRHTNKFYLRYGDIVSRNPLPQVLADKLIKSMEKGIDVKPLVKCWARYMRPVKGRPAYSESRAKLFAEYISAAYTDDVKVSELVAKEGFAPEVAREQATTTQVAITQEGLLVCYKVSEEITHKFVKNTEQDGGVKEVKRYDYVVDEITGETKDIMPEADEDRLFQPAIQGQNGDAFKCGETLGHVIRVGQVHQLESWDQVDCTDNVACKKGLHVGGLRYIQGYSEGADRVTHNIFVDPMDIGAIVGLGTGNDGAMRVRRYMVYSTFRGANKKIYHSSTYAAMTDADYAKLVEEAVEATKMAAAEAEKMLNQDKALQVVTPDSNDGVATASTGDVFGK